MSRFQATNPFLRADPWIRSLNRARIIELPGVNIDEGVLGKSGYELLSAVSLRQQIVDSAAALELDPHSPDLVRQFDRYLGSPQVRTLAMEIARSYGRRFGYLLLMLKRGDMGNRAVRTEWSDEHWAFWQSVRHIHLGGGVIAGNLGRHAIQAARQLVEEHGMDNLTIDISPHALYLPLLGLARAAPADADSMLLLDFGQTSVKRGLASYRSRRLTKLHLLAPVPAVCGDGFQLEETLEEVRGRWQQMLEIIEESWRHVLPSQQQTRTALGICLACHLPQGHPSPSEKGCYSSLQLLCDHLETFIKEQLATHLKLAPPLVLMNDANAAATVYAGAHQTVVITLGTAIGTGFPPAPTSTCRRA